MSSNEWRRVSMRERCPICDRPDWCLLAADGTAAICTRVSDGAVKPIGDSGWLHRFRDRDGWAGGGPRRVAVSIRGSRQPRADLEELDARFRADVTPKMVAWLGSDLGLSGVSLNRLGVGWCIGSSSWSFPMRETGGGIVGIRLRAEDGRKFAVRGGHNALFIPDALTGSGPLLIAEGTTDTAAALDLGFDAFGRPSCTGGKGQSIALVLRLAPESVVVVADNDPRGQGRDGAIDLARALAPYHREVRLIAPPAGVKDLRAWLRAGASRHDLVGAIEGAERFGVRLMLRRVAAGGRHG